MINRQWITAIKSKKNGKTGKTVQAYVNYYIDCATSPASEPARLGYYSEAAGTGEPPGVWWSPNNFQVQHGGVVQPFLLRRLADGLDAKTSQPLLKQQREKRRVALDLAMTPPKDFSILFARQKPDSPERQKLRDILHNNVNIILELIHKNGLFESREGKDGVIRTPVKSFSSANFLHHSNRSGDPNLHIHPLITTVVERENGTIGSLNNEKFVEQRKFLDAVFKFNVARDLEKLGIKVKSHEEHGWTIDSISDELRDDFSERRMQIKAEAAKQGLSQTKNNVEWAQIVALQTRGAKNDVPPLHLLNPIWNQTFKDHGVDENPEWARMDKPPIVRDDAEQPAIMAEIVDFALNKITETRSYFRPKDLSEEVILNSIGHVDHIANIDNSMKALHKKGVLVDLGEANDDVQLTTAQIIAEEQRIIEITKHRKDESSIFSPAARKAAFSDEKLSQQQRDALDDAMNGGGVVGVQGGAGVGKTTAMAGIKRAAELDGLNLLLCSPEWKAAGTLAMELEREHKYSIDRIINRFNSGKLKLDQDSIILCDEAGKMSRRLAFKLIEISEKTDCKLIFVGDTRQMSSVQAGDPFSLICAANPARQIREIRRQKVDWQRKASMMAQEGKQFDALMGYNAHGQVNIIEDTDTLIASLAAAWAADGGKAQVLTSSNRNVTTLNTALREHARGLGMIQGEDVVIQAIPRGKNTKPVKLHLATGDRLITGAQLDFGDHQVENGTIFTRIEIIGDQIGLTAEDGRVYETTLGQFARSGRNGSALSIQHAYCLSTMSSQGGTWDKVMWHASGEDIKSSYVAMTRHREDLQIFISKDTVRQEKFGMFEVDQEGLNQLEDHVEDELTDDLVLKKTGGSLSRPAQPRNALDIIAAPARQTENEVNANSNLNPNGTMKNNSKTIMPANIQPQNIPENTIPF